MLSPTVLLSLWTTCSVQAACSHCIHRFHSQGGSSCSAASLFPRKTRKPA